MTWQFHGQQDNIKMITYIFIIGGIISVLLCLARLYGFYKNIQAAKMIGLPFYLSRTWYINFTIQVFRFSTIQGNLTYSCSVRPCRRVLSSLLIHLDTTMEAHRPQEILGPYHRVCLVLSNWLINHNLFVSGPAILAGHIDWATAYLKNSAMILSS